MNTCNRCHKAPSEIGRKSCRKCLDRECARLREKYTPSTARKDMIESKLGDVDWTMDQKAIAKSAGLSIPTVMRYRCKHGIEVGRKSRWDSVDWNMSPASIAHSLGVSAVAVYYQIGKRGFNGNKTK